jgi:protein-S-isoprenylcysteine O-methyltransferase Ste14
MPLVPGPDGALAAPHSARQKELVVDFGERLLLVAMYIWFVSRMLPSVWSHPYNMLALIAETFTVTFVVIRRPGTTAATFYAWAVAFIGTCLPLAVVPVAAPLVPVWAGAFLMLYGLMISFSAKLTLRRSFGVVAACRGVRRGGPYKFVRHPMYLGYCVTNVGFLLLNPAFWNFAIYGIAFVATLLRIGEEEKMLCHDEAYGEYAGAVRHRLFPGLY